MDIIDISRTIAPDATIFPGDPELKFDWYVDMASGGTWNELMIHGWTGHRMAHVDSPKHFVQGGDSITDIDLARFVTPALVVEVTDDIIMRTHVDQLTGIENKAVLFKTRNSQRRDNEPYDKDAVHLDESAAQALIESKVSLAGIDYLSIDTFGSTVVHETLLGAGVLIMEGLQLRDAAPGEYTLIALPLKIAEADASCVRAILTNPTQDT